MGKFEVRGGASSVRVEGDNWLVALGASLPHFGLDSSSMSRLSVDVAPSGLVTVRDPVSGSSFELEPVSEEPQQVKVPIALDPERIIIATDDPYAMGLHDIHIVESQPFQAAVD